MTSTDIEDPVADAAGRIPAARFHGEDGKAVRPCTPPEVTYRHLRMFDIRPGHHVLEVGTGSGYSGALLAHLAGPAGRVTTIDIDERLHHRAKALYEQHGHPVTAVLGDGLAGYPDGKPYDRIFVGTTPPTIPAAWLDQLAVGGRLITGCRLHALPGTYAVAHLTRHADAFDVTVHAGGYTPMVMPAALGSGPGPVSVTSTNGTDLNAATDEGTANAWLAALRLGTVTDAGIEPGDFLHLKNWLLARDPDGLFVATTEHGTGIGVGSDRDPVSAAMLTDTHRMSGGPQTATEHLDHLIAAWRSTGSPTTDSLRAALVRQGDSYQVQLARPEV